MYFVKYFLSGFVYIFNFIVGFKTIFYTWIFYNLNKWFVKPIIWNSFTKDLMKIISFFLCLSLKC